jgi:hypothetical protein
MVFFLEGLNAVLGSQFSVLRKTRESSGFHWELGTRNFREIARPLALKLALEPNGGQEMRRWSGPEQDPRLTSKP